MNIRWNEGLIFSQQRKQNKFYLFGYYKSNYCASVYWMYKALCGSLAFCLGMRHFVSMKNLKYFTKIKMKFKFQ